MKLFLVKPFLALTEALEKMKNDVLETETEQLTGKLDSRGYWETVFLDDNKEAIEMMHLAMAA